jgi:hypothetical protein
VDGGLGWVHQPAECHMGWVLLKLLLLQLCLLLPPSKKKYPFFFAIKIIPPYGISIGAIEPAPTHRELPRGTVNQHHTGLPCRAPPWQRPSHCHPPSLLPLERLAPLPHREFSPPPLQPCIDGDCSNTRLGN